MWEVAALGVVAVQRHRSPTGRHDLEGTSGRVELGRADRRSIGDVRMLGVVGEVIAEAGPPSAV
jgi:hypothetical protein